MDSQGSQSGDQQVIQIIPFLIHDAPKTKLGITLFAVYNLHTICLSKVFVSKVLALGSWLIFILAWYKM